MPQIFDLWHWQITLFLLQTFTAVTAKIFLQIFGQGCAATPKSEAEQRRYYSHSVSTWFSMYGNIKVRETFSEAAINFGCFLVRP